jgi:uncharacterized protein YkwD
MVLAVAALAAAAGPAAAHASSCPETELRPAEGNVAQIAQATLCLINEQRAAERLSPLAEQVQLTKASADYSALMVAQRFFSHVSPGGGELTDRLTAAGYLGHPGSWAVGENIAWGESYLASPAEIVKAWMGSPGHRKNILNPDFEEIGLGIALGTPSTSNPGATYTTDFGRRRIEGAPDEPRKQAQTEAIVGTGNAALTPAAGGSRGASTRSATRAAQRKAKARRAGMRRSRAACRRAHRRARFAKRGAPRHVRCVGAWRAVKKHL